MLKDQLFFSKNLLLFNHVYLIYQKIETLFNCNQINTYNYSINHGFTNCPPTQWHVSF